MATKIFLNNDWQDYDYEYCHDHEGYTDHATTSVTYKTTDPWGGTASNSGYYDHPSGVYDFIQRIFFVSGVVGWFSPNTLALQGYYPSDSTEFIVIKNGVVSNAVYWEDVESGDPSDTMYLVEADINTGWMTQAEYEASGWQPYTPDESPKGYIVVDSNGSIQNSVYLNKMFIHQIQHSVNVVNFYFTSNGAAETENTFIESGVDVTLYNADGSIADDDLYDGSGTLTYTQANGNMFEAADGGDLISLQSGALVMNPNADYTALCVQVEECVSTTLDMILGLKWDKDNDQWKTVAFNQEPSDNFWWNGLLNEADKTKVINFGLSTALDNPEYKSFGNIGAIVWDRRYTFEVIDLYSDLGQTSVPGYNLNNLRTDYYNVGGNDILVIWSDVQDDTPVKAWKCRISKKPYIDVDFAFAFDSATGTILEAVQPTRSDWWYSGILTQEDEDRINAFGLRTNLYSNRQGTIGSVIYDNNYLFEMIGMFADVVDGHGSGSIAYDSSKFYCSGRGMGTRTYLVINNTDAFPTAAKVWRCRITKLNP